MARIPYLGGSYTAEYGYGVYGRRCQRSAAHYVAAVALWLFRKHMVARRWAYWHLSPQGVGFAEIYIDLCYSVSGPSVGAGLGNLLDRTVAKQSALRLLVGSWLPTKLLLK